ncbi:Hypothetical protein SCF082_LOCUS48152 [Durusdinium trenchii]|uniref:Ion transport domain-containing protein n=2 Tax=Durusdinium trenchii TaxID=1381693 RepID=A0ABP0RUH0_9DINO
MSYHAAARQEEDGMDFIWNESPCRGGPLHLAVLKDELPKVKDLVEKSKSPLETVRSPFAFRDHDTEQEGRAEAVHIAASRGHLEVIKYLLEKQADPNACVMVNGKVKHDVLHAAVAGEGRGGRLDMVDFLYSVCRKTKDSEGRSLIHIAFLTGSREIIEYLRDKNSDLKHMHSFHEDPSVAIANENAGVHPPLSFGIHGGQMSEEDLSEMAQPTAGSLKIFIDECPQCIPTFLQRIREQDSIGALEIARHLTCHDISKVLRESPEAALALLQICTAEPECENAGWHPLPTRVSFADRDWKQRIRTLFNPIRYMVTFYVNETTWRFDSNRFEHPPWHKYITDRSFGRPVLDAEIRVCYVEDLLCAEVFGAMTTEENVASDSVAEDDLIRAAVRHVFWNGCCRVDLTTVLLNFWGLGLLIAEEVLMYDGDAAGGNFGFRTGKGRRLFTGRGAGVGVPAGSGSRGNGNIFVNMLGGVVNEPEEHSLEAWIAIAWIGAKGGIDLWQEWLQFRGLCKIGRTWDYFAVDNLFDMLFSSLPVFLFFNPGNLLVLICAVFLYWCRLLDCFTSAEFIGLEILPIRQMAMGLLPALAVTCVAFCAFTHAFYLVNGGPKVESMVDIVFETFATLITAALPPDISTGTGNQVKLILCILAVSFFTVFILNIFIGVMGELYVKEKQRAEHTFRMYRAGSCYQYLLRSRVLQCNLMSADRGLLLMLVSGCVALTVQILGFINHEQRIPGTSIIFFVCQALILLGAYQSPDTPWVKGGRSGYQLWFCKEKSEKVQEPLVQDVSNTLEHMKGFLGEKEKTS